MTNEAGRTSHVVEKNCVGSGRPGRRPDQAMSSLILKRSPIGVNQEDYGVLEDSVVVGRIFLMPIGLKGRPWMWVIRDRKGRTPTHGHEPTRSPPAPCDTPRL